MALALLFPTLVIADGIRDEEESLITQFGPEFSDYDQYQPFSMKEHKTHFTVWKSKTRGFSDHYAINVGEIAKKTKSLDDFKASQDAPAKRTCITHSSTAAEKTVVNGYEAISWTSTCELDKLTITSIEMAIMGNQNFYHLRKLWKFPVPDEKIAAWQALLSQTTVCDSSNSAHTCPVE
jgi:hypothetical protein